MNIITYQEQMKQLEKAKRIARRKLLDAEDRGDSPQEVERLECALDLAKEAIAEVRACGFSDMMLRTPCAVR